MLVIGRQKVVAIPHEDGESVEIKALSWKKLMTAQRVQQSAGISFMKEIGPELMEAMRSGDAKTVKNIEAVQEASISNYDRFTLLQKGIISWTYEAELNDENLEELDEKTAAVLASAIFHFSRGTDTKDEASDE